jgi:hypothetical protein
MPYYSEIMFLMFNFSYTNPHANEGEIILRMRTAVCGAGIAGKKSNSPLSKYSDCESVSSDSPTAKQRLGGTE